MKLFPSIHDSEISTDDLQRKSSSHQGYGQQGTSGNSNCVGGG